MPPTLELQISAASALAELLIEKEKESLAFEGTDFLLHQWSYLTSPENWSIAQQTGHEEQDSFTVVRQFFLRNNAVRTKNAIAKNKWVS